MPKTILIAGDGPLAASLARCLSRGPDDRAHVVSLGARGLAEARGLSGRIDEVWHAGAQLGPALRRARAGHERELQATQALLDFVRGSGCRALHLVSTVFVAGTRPGALLEGPFDARFPVRSLFEESHRAAERSAEALSRAEGLCLRVFRVALPMSWQATEDAAAGDLQGLLSLLCRFKEDIERKAPGYLQRRPLRLLASAEATPSFADADPILFTAPNASGREPAGMRS